MKDLLDTLGNYETEFHMKIDLSNDSFINGYWLHGCDAFDKPLPVAPPVNE